MEPEILENEGIPKMKENRKLPETALIIETFNRIGGVNYGTKSRRELEKMGQCQEFCVIRIVDLTPFFQRKIFRVT